ncbi:MAG: hypothetical protein ACYCXA_11755 [Actinomycetes bacterium]
MKRMRRPAFAAVALALALPLLTGCGAGFNASQAIPFTNQEGVNAQTGQMRVLNAFAVDSLGSDNLGAMSFTVANQGAEQDTLTSVTVLPVQAAAATITGDATIAPKAATTFGYGNGPSVTLTGMAAKPGTFMTVTFNFQVAGSLSMKIPVWAPSGVFKEVTPNPSISPPAG